MKLSDIDRAIANGAESRAGFGCVEDRKMRLAPTGHR